MTFFHIINFFFKNPKFCHKNAIANKGDIFLLLFCRMENFLTEKIWNGPEKNKNISHVLNVEQKQIISLTFRFMIISFLPFSFFFPM